MFFWIMFVLLIIFIIAILLSTFSGEGDAVMATILGTVILSIPVIGIWSSHANDLAKISTQQQIIEVHKERIESLEKRLSEFNYPEKPMISLDGDAPWGSIIKSLSKAEDKIAQAKEERAEAKRSVEATRKGPFSGVVWFVGDYKE